MRKITVLFLTVMLVVGFAGLTQAAKKAKPDALVDITGVSCKMTPDGNGDKLEAKWSWAPIELTPLQTQFGGDAIYKVDVYLNGAVEPITVGLEVEIVKFDIELDDFDGKMSYYCEDSLCTGDAYPVSDEFIMDALVNLFPDAEEIIYERIDFAEEVWVKAMNPGTGSKRQNYPLVDVCGNLVD